LQKKCGRLWTMINGLSDKERLNHWPDTAVSASSNDT
jgi:hypothetical protein